jgi:two-component system, NtrC family, response regulator AtoC
MDVSLSSPSARSNVAPPVLIVDDEPLILWSISETLKHEGYTVVEARDARGALAAVAAAASPFGVVVLDLRLPDCGDLSLLSRVHTAMADAQIIVMTAHGTWELEDAALSLGAYRVMHKPFGMAELVEMVEQANHDRMQGFGGNAS